MYIQELAGSNPAGRSKEKDMRIISKFHDYYDGAGGWFSETPVFVRQEQEKSIKAPTNEAKEALSKVLNIFNKVPHFRESGTIYGVIAFCGKAYPYYHCLGQYFYNTNAMEKHCKGILESENDISYYKGTAKHIIKWLNYCPYRSYHDSMWYSALTHREWDRFVNEISVDLSPEPFRFVGSPVFLINGQDNLIVNPNLRTYNFMSQIDPYTAYQEIEMYLGNELANQMDPNIKRSDDLVRDSKGFDGWSFRRHKEDSKKFKKRG